MPSLRLDKVTPANVDAACDLRVRPDQEHLVESVARSLAEAYVWPDVVWPRLVYDGDELVGFLMGFFRIPWREDTPTDLRSGLWRLNIAAEKQGRGYGRFAVRSLAEEARRRGETRIHTTWQPGDDGPEEFYLRLGFRLNGERSGGQTVGELDLAAFLAVT